MSVTIKKPKKKKEAPPAKTEGHEVASEISHHPLLSLRHEIDRLFDDMLPRSRFSPFKNWGFEFPSFPRLTHGVGALATIPKSDVSETDKDFVIRAELPGMSEDDIEVTVSGGVITIKGEKRSEREENKPDYHLSECTYGAVRRSYPVPEGVDQDKVKGEFENGVLTLSLPKTKAAAPKKITVTAKGK